MATTKKTTRRTKATKQAPPSAIKRHKAPYTRSQAQGDREPGPGEEQRYRGDRGRDKGEQSQGGQGAGRYRHDHRATDRRIGQDPTDQTSPL